MRRCQVHKRRNVLDHLTDEQKPAVANALNAAYAREDYAATKEALQNLHRELMDLNPSAARSLGEGMEDTLLVHRLHLQMQLRKTLSQGQPGDGFPSLLFGEVQAQPRDLRSVIAVPGGAHQPSVGMAGTQQTMAGFMRHGIAHEEVKRYPEFLCLRPNGRHEHAGIMPTAGVGGRAAHLPRPATIVDWPPGQARPSIRFATGSMACEAELSKPTILFLLSIPSIREVF